jgi:hypothetical protein
MRPRRRCRCCPATRASVIITVAATTDTRPQHHINYCTHEIKLLQAAAVFQPLAQCARASVSHSVAELRIDHQTKRSEQPLSLAKENKKKGVQRMMVTRSSFLSL